MNLITWECDLSILGVLDACNHLLVCRVKMVVLLNIAATWLSRSKGIAMPLCLAKIQIRYRSYKNILKNSEETNRLLIVYEYNSQH